MLSRLEHEMREQGDDLAGREERGRMEAEAAAELLRADHVDYLMIVARGSSDNAARYGQYLLGGDADDEGVPDGAGAPDDRVAWDDDAPATPGDGTGSGFTIKELSTLNTTVLAPMPRASESTAIAVNPGLFRRIRRAYRLSWWSSSKSLKP